MTLLTQIHHRQTRSFIIQGIADTGVTWSSEVAFQEQAGDPIETVAITAGKNMPRHRAEPCWNLTGDANLQTLQDSRACDGRRSPAPAAA